VVGPSWEGFVIEQLLSVAPEGSQGFFYRASGGAEIDLLIAFRGDCLWAVEIKRSLSPRPERGFHSACAELRPERRYLVYPGEAAYPSTDGVKVISLPELARVLGGSTEHPRKDLGEDT
jgi:predicted AAA+ superfamily ATPase